MSIQYGIILILKRVVDFYVLTCYGTFIFSHILTEYAYFVYEVRVPVQYTVYSTLRDYERYTCVQYCTSKVFSFFQVFEYGTVIHGTQNYVLQ